MTRYTVVSLAKGWWAVFDLQTGREVPDANWNVMGTKSEAVALAGRLNSATGR